MSDEAMDVEDLQAMAEMLKAINLRLMTVRDMADLREAAVASIVAAGAPDPEAQAIVDIAIEALALVKKAWALA